MQRIHRHEDKVHLVLTVIIGAVVGLVVVAFILVTENLGSRIYPPGSAAWRRALAPVLGSLITGFLLSKYFPNARGSGIPQTKAALFIRDGYISLRTVLGKFGLSSIALASGIALGREGPSVQVGAGIASLLGRRLGLSPASVKALVPVGASAALAAAFNTPIAAVLFSLEEVMGDLNAPVLGSIVLSSATSWIVLHLLLGDEPLFHVPPYQLVHPVEFAFYGVLGIVVGLVSTGFVKLLLEMRKRFLKMPVNTRWIQPVAGGLLVGLLGWVVPQVLGVGYGFVSEALNGQIALSMMAILVVLKVLATATCYASGNAGGIFGPSLFIGAMAGGAIGEVAHLALPDYTGSIGAYALVGMGAAFAGIIRVPLTSVIMIFEITRDYSIIVPLMIANLVSYFISSRLQKEPIYEALQHQDGIHLPTGARARAHLLTVSDVARPATNTLPAGDTVEQALPRATGEQTAWPVLNGNKLLGMITQARLEQAKSEGRGDTTLAQLVPAEDSEESLTAENFPHVHPDHPADTALRRMAATGLDAIPVVSRAYLRQLIGVISMQDVMRGYGFGGSRGQVEEAAPGSGGSEARMVGVLAILAGVLLTAVLLNYVYRVQRGERAQSSFQAGNELMGKGRYPEAVEEYRAALSISHKSDHRLALASALVKAGRLNEASIYLRELVRENPASGPVNLELGRVAVGEAKIEEAVTAYHRAIYGSWPANPEQNRFQARLELVEALRQAGQRQLAQAELLSQLAEAQGDVATKKKVGRMLLDYGLPKEAAELFRALGQRDKQDVEARAGLAEAAFAMEDYLAARNAWRAALQLNPGDAVMKSRLELCERIVALDPTLRRLGSSERFRRSEELLKLTLSALEECATSGGAEELPAEARQAGDTARKELARRGRPRSYGDAADGDMALAEKLWAARSALCASKPSDGALSLVMARVAQ